MSFYFVFLTKIMFCFGVGTHILHLVDIFLSFFFLPCILTEVGLLICHYMYHLCILT
jgi:hypothetical protein